MDRPVRYEERSRPGIEEGPRKPRQRFRAGLVGSCGVAGRQHYPIGIELEQRDLARREEAVVKLGRLCWQGERERRFAKSRDVAGDETVGRKMPSRPGEFHPEPLTEPDLNLSIHPARAIA